MVDQKNILIMGSPRSGTHALGSQIANDLGYENLGEICRVNGQTDAKEDIKSIFDHKRPRIAHITQMLSKIQLSGMVSLIKEHCEIILLRRRDKIMQFASWMYFHKNGGISHGWQTQKPEDMLIQKSQLMVDSVEIDHFLMEQMLDDFFCPDRIVYYEDMDLSGSRYAKNVYAWDLKLIFANLDYVKTRLDNWKYFEMSYE